MREESMTRISIRGIKNHKRRELIRFAANYLVEELVGPRMNLNIEIRFGDIYTKHGIHGECEALDLERFPRNFIVSIDTNKNLRYQLRVLVHELVHVKQYARNQMYDYFTRPNYTRWNNKVINNEETGWKHRPWEIEANGKEIPLLTKFLKETKIKLKEYD